MCKQNGALTVGKMRAEKGEREKKFTVGVGNGNWFVIFRWTIAQFVWAFRMKSGSVNNVNGIIICVARATDVRDQITKWWISIVCVHPPRCCRFDFCLLKLFSPSHEKYILIDVQTIIVQATQFQMAIDFPPFSLFIPPNDKNPPLLY